MNIKAKVNFLIYIGELGKAGEYVITVYETFVSVPRDAGLGFHFGNARKVTRKVKTESGFVANEDIDEFIDKQEGYYKYHYGENNVEFEIEVIEQ